MDAKKGVVISLILVNNWCCNYNFVELKLAIN